MSLEYQLDQFCYEYISDTLLMSDSFFSCKSGDLVFDFQEVQHGIPTRKVLITTKKMFGLYKDI
jgi:hypothetical protein